MLRLLEREALLLGVREARRELLALKAPLLLLAREPEQLPADLRSYAVHLRVVRVLF